MVFINHRSNPSTRKAQIRVRLSATPTLSRSDPDAALQLTLTLSRAPVGGSHDDDDDDKRPLTFATHHSICEVTEPGEEGGIDIFARGGFGLLRSASGDRTRNISLGHFRTNDRWRSESDDLRERGIRFVTVPPAVGTTTHGSPGSAAATTTTITHTLNWERIFRKAWQSGRTTRDDLVPGEVFEIGINHGYMGTIWWCWGDLETDLRDKRLHRWHQSDFALAGEKPDEDELARQGGNWVLGEDPRFLDWVDVTEAEEGQGQKVRFQIVE
ncbi:hypothetical protein PG991_008523 [Apiospora marii]|uniref:Protein HRI1 n=1 Tax=Apiospora marii TaxID=335849 RepID=A0ABR1RMA8_9PEZI